MPEVVCVQDDLHPAVLRGHAAQQLAAAVGGGVVGDDHIERIAGHGFKRAGNPVEQLLEIFNFIETAGNDGDFFHDVLILFHAFRAVPLMSIPPAERSISGPARRTRAPPRRRSPR